jgi:hypothetical protein
VRCTEDLQKNTFLTSLQLSETLAKSGSRFLLTHGDPKEERSIGEMDSAVAAVRLLSPLVDDLASDLPAPLHQSQTKKQVSGGYSKITVFLLEICPITLSNGK